MSQDCDISRRFKGKFKNRRDISARISLYNGTIKKKGGRTYAYFTDNRLKKYYGDEPNITKALDGVSLSIEPGEFVAIIGTSGSGKSTLLNMMGGLDVPTSGKVIVDGKDLSTLNEEHLAIFRRRKSDLCFKITTLFPF